MGKDTFANLVVGVALNGVRQETFSEVGLKDLQSTLTQVEGYLSKMFGYTGESRKLKTPISKLLCLPLIIKALIASYSI